MIEERATTTSTPAVREAGDELSATARAARAAVQERAGQLGEVARSSLDDARSAVAEQSAAVKDQAVDEIARTARGLEAAAQELEGSPLQQELLREASDGLKQISRAVSGKSVGAIVEDLSDFGRHNPVAYLGGAALAGFALARFARASAPVEDRAAGYGDDSVGRASVSDAPGIPDGTTPPRTVTVDRTGDSDNA
jgi:hypothetical protein